MGIHNNSNNNNNKPKHNKLQNLCLKIIALVSSWQGKKTDRNNKKKYKNLKIAFSKNQAAITQQRGEVIPQG